MWLKAKSFLEAEISWQIVCREVMSMETKGEGGKDLKGVSQSRRRLAKGQGGLLPVQCHALCIAKAEVHVS